MIHNQVWSSQLTFASEFSVISVS